MKKKRVYNEARLDVVRLSGKSQLLAGSDVQTTSAPNAARTDYTTVANGFGFQ